MRQAEFDRRWEAAARQVRDALGLRLTRERRVRIRWRGRVIFEHTWRTEL